MNQKYTPQQVNAGSIPLDVNVTIQHIGADGKAKAIFQESKLGNFLMKKGIVSPSWINSKLSPVLSPFMGSWSSSKLHANLITNAGKAAVASRINGSGAEAVFASIGQGTGVTAANVADTALGTEVTASGGAASGVHVVAGATASRTTTTVTNDTATFVGTVSITGTIAVTESGVFNATTNGTLLARQVFSAINVVNGDSLQYTWNIKAA